MILDTTDYYHWLELNNYIRLKRLNHCYYGKITILPPWHEEQPGQDARLTLEAMLAMYGLVSISMKIIILIIDITTDHQDFVGMQADLRQAQLPTLLWLMISKHPWKLWRRIMTNTVTTFLPFLHLMRSLRAFSWLSSSSWTSWPLSYRTLTYFNLIR